VLSPSLKIHTHLPMSIDCHDSPDGSGRFAGCGVVSGHKAGFCSLAAFRKLIALFGFKLGSDNPGKSNENVEHPDIARGSNTGTASCLCLMKRIWTGELKLD